MDNTKHSSANRKNAANVENLLKPCPFCGAPLTIDYNMEPHGNGYKIQHTCFAHKLGNYLACASVVVYGDTKREVAELWNRRAKT